MESKSEDGSLCLGRGVVGEQKIKETGSENASTEIIERKGKRQKGRKKKG